MEESGDPFSPTSRLLSLNSPLSNGNQPNGTSLSPSLARAPFSRLSMPAPGGDTFSRSLIESVPASVQSATTAAGTAEQTAAAKIQQQTAPTAKIISGQSKTGTARVHSANGAKLKSRVSPAPTRQISSRQTGAAQTTLPIKSNVAEPGSHIGATSSSISATSSMSVGTSTGALNHPIGTVGIGTGLNSAHGIGRGGGR